MVFDQTTYNVGSGFNTSTGIFTAPSTGYYLFIIRIDYISNSNIADATLTLNVSSTGSRLIWIGHPGALLFSAQGNQATVSGTDIISMTANDTVYAALYTIVTGGGTYQLYNAIFCTTFQCRYLGP
jgi:hypothetical protein